MRNLILAIFVCVGLALAFIVGTFTSVLPLMMVGFCLWTPAVAFFGFSLARAGLRVTFNEAADAPPVRRRAITSLQKDMA